MRELRPRLKFIGNDMSNGIRDTMDTKKRREEPCLGTHDVFFMDMIGEQDIFHLILMEIPLLEKYRKRGLF
jgi:hypothetical protein